jgi:hypothetical protein
MNDDNMQMQSLRTQEDVRLHFGTDAMYPKHDFSLLTSATHYIHSLLISPQLHYMKKQQPNGSSFPIILSRPVYETHGPNANTDSVSATYA